MKRRSTTSTSSCPTLMEIVAIAFAAAIFASGIFFAIKAMQNGTVAVPPTGIEAYR